MNNPPRKPKNIEQRNREYLTPSEIEQLINVGKKNTRNGLRDATMILICFRHGLRVSELVSLKWSQIELKQGLLHVVRRKSGVNTTHPLYSVELRALKSLKKEYSHMELDYVFISERKQPISDATFRKMLAKAGRDAGFDMPIHPHMLRHSTGFKLVNDGHDIRSIQHYLGHKNIQHTVRYTEVSPSRFKGFWDD